MMMPYKFLQCLSDFDTRYYGIDWDKSLFKIDNSAYIKYDCKTINEIDAWLYDKYDLTAEEVQFIESMIKPME